MFKYVVSRDIKQLIHHKKTAPANSGRGGTHMATVSRVLSWAFIHLDAGLRLRLKLPTRLCAEVQAVPLWHKPTPE
jgi:hypothetical protein